MQLLRSIVVDSTPPIATLFKFATIELLKAIKGVLLLYPINVLLLTLTLYLIVNRITSRFARKKKFKATYQPLPHQDSPLEELKLIKKDVRDVQADLIALLKEKPQQESIKAESGIEVELSEGVKAFMAEVQEKSTILQEVEGELKQTVSEAFRQISKINQQ